MYHTYHLHAMLHISYTIHIVYRQCFISYISSTCNASNIIHIIYMQSLHTFIYSYIICMQCFILNPYPESSSVRSRKCRAYQPPMCDHVSMHMHMVCVYVLLELASHSPFLSPPLPQWPPTPPLQQAGHSWPRKCGCSQADLNCAYGISPSC